MLVPKRCFAFGAMVEVSLSLSLSLNLAADKTSNKARVSCRAVPCRAGSPLMMFGRRTNEGTSRNIKSTIDAYDTAFGSS